jgi:hypothetical protein
MHYLWGCAWEGSIWFETRTWHRLCCVHWVLWLFYFVLLGQYHRSGGQFLEVLGSNLKQGSVCPDFFTTFSVLPGKYCKRVITGHGRFPPNPLQFIIHDLPTIWRFIILADEEFSHNRRVNKLINTGPSREFPRNRPQPLRPSSLFSSTCITYLYSLSLFDFFLIIF